MYVARWLLLPGLAWYPATLWGGSQGSSGVGLNVHPGVVLLVVLLESDPDGGAALEARAKAKLPHAVALLHALCCLDVCPCVPAGTQSMVSLPYLGPELSSAPSDAGRKGRSSMVVARQLEQAQPQAGTDMRLGGAQKEHGE